MDEKLREALHWLDQVVRIRGSKHPTAHYAQTIKAHVDAQAERIAELETAATLAAHPPTDQFIRGVMLKDTRIAELEAEVAALHKAMPSTIQDRSSELTFNDGLDD